MREDRSISWDQLQQSILSKLYYLMINGAQAQVQVLPLPPHIESDTLKKNHKLQFALAGFTIFRGEETPAVSSAEVNPKNPF